MDSPLSISELLVQVNKKTCISLSHLDHTCIYGGGKSNSESLDWNKGK